ncbi:helix-turn-helix domain-containing protein [Shewanella sp. SM72]|uniref:helix-turn-helix domain-containing protein n=1 Tax=Shewanella sp. SM72 TaxID=2912805 RepID=UPI0021D8EF09|nr:helix-turn-helix transcriptional regulator [Shewanella sp. SM72]MCU8017853.1 helix-turn-helix domain-containing protein [Shewanella sp. SM72]
MKTTAFGRYLRKLRIDHGMIMKDLAEVLKVSSAYLSALELGKKTIAEKNIITIVEYFDLNSQEAQELRYSASISQPSVKIDLSGKTNEQRELAVSFARRYQEISPEEQQRLLELLRG